MATGTMSSDANYPSDNGIPIQGAGIVGTFGYTRNRVSYSIGGTPGTGASYKLQSLLRDNTNSAGDWVDVASSTLSGDGPAATGNVVVDVIGEAVRLVSANGTSPTNPTYTLNAYPLEEIC